MTATERETETETEREREKERDLTADIIKGRIHKLPVQNMCSFLVLGVFCID